MLNRKLLRDLRRQVGLLLAVLIVIGLGVMLFVGSAAGYLDLSTSYARVQDDLGLASLHVDARVSAEDLARVSKIPGVAQIDARTVVSVPVDLHDEVQIEGRVLTLPDSGEPKLDRVILLSGQLPGPGELLVETHLAEYHHLAVGDAVTVKLGSQKKDLRISGVAVSAEYLWVARDEQDPMPTPTEFGVFWARRAEVRTLAGAMLGGADMAMALASSPELAAAMAGVVSAAGDDDGQLLVALTPDADPAGVSSAIRKTLGGAVLKVTPRSKLVGLRLLQMDVDGLRGMAAFFPVFFLGVAAFVFAAVLARMVDSQREIIGTLLALGVPRGRVLRHYLAFALLVGGVGSLLGTLGGVAMGRELTAEYAAELHIPQVTSEARWGLWLAGLAMGVAVALLAAIGPAWRASRLAPAVAMRPPAPRAGRAMLWTRRLSFLPLGARLAIRGIVRRPLRSTATALGVAAALVLVVTTSGMMESIARAIGVQTEDSWRYDDRGDLLSPRPAQALMDEAKALPGVAEAEVALGLPIRIQAGGLGKDTVGMGLEPGAKLLRSVDFEGAERMPKPGGVVLSRALMHDLGATTGQSVSVRALPDGVEHSLHIDGVAEAAIGGTAILRREDLAKIAGLPDQANTVLIKARDGQQKEALDGLRHMNGVVRVQDVASLRAMLGDFTGLIVAFVGSMLLVSVVLAGAVLYDTASLSILERRRELATMRALGQSMREIAFSTTLEHAVLGLGGLIIGLPLSALALRYILDLYSSDMFDMPFVLSARTVGVAVLGVAIVLVVAQWPALREISRTNLADAVRTREG